jgi:hypothetical protein
MKKIFILVLVPIIIFILLGCSSKPPHHPKNPDYSIKKPKVKYKPSKKNLEKMVKQLQGSPYVWAEEGPYQFDCSGFTYYMYGSMGIDIPRVAREQARVGKRVSSNDLQYGDLIFFATSKRSKRRITHVGMYLGDGWFTHASTVKHEVIYSNLFKSKYYRNKLRICRRYLPEKTRTLIEGSASNIWEKVPTPTKIPTQKAIILNAPQSQTEQASAKGNYYLQVGSFMGPPDSLLVYRIKIQHLPYRVIQYKQVQKLISKLLIGPFKTRQKALDMLPKVKKTIEPNAFIAEIR